MLKATVAILGDAAGWQAFLKCYTRWWVDSVKMGTARVRLWQTIQVLPFFVCVCLKWKKNTLYQPRTEVLCGFSTIRAYVAGKSGHKWFSEDLCKEFNNKLTWFKRVGEAAEAVAIHRQSVTNKAFPLRDASWVRCNGSSSLCTICVVDIWGRSSYMCIQISTPAELNTTKEAMFLFEAFF